MIAQTASLRKSYGTVEPDRRSGFDGTRLWAKMSTALWLTCGKDLTVQQLAIHHILMTLILNSKAQTILLNSLLFINTYLGTWTPQWTVKTIYTNTSTDSDTTFYSGAIMPVVIRSLCIHIDSTTSLIQFIGKELCFCLISFVTQTRRSTMVVGGFI